MLLPAITVEDFQAEYDVQEGGQVGDYTIDSMEAAMEFERYEIPARVTYSCPENEKDKLMAAVKQHIGEDGRIVYSALGSPYEVYYGKPEIETMGEGKITLFQTGCAIRRRDLPTQAQAQSAPSGAPKKRKAK